MKLEKKSPRKSMEATRIYLDTNIIADAIDPLREGHKKSIAILQLCILKDISIFISEDILTTLYYISRDKAATLKFIQNIILTDWHILTFGKKIIQNATTLSLEKNLDLEDILQCLCAKENSCQLLITNDKKFYTCGMNIVGYKYFEKTKALFLDRDGIINVDHGYVYKIDDFEFVDGIFDLVKLFTDAGYMIFIVTNQSGIGRGYYSEEDFTMLTEWMIQKFNDENITIEKVYHCPHSPEDKCHCRKPETGMIEQALKEHTLDLSHSWMIGNKQSDIDLAVNAGIGFKIAIDSKNIENADYVFNTIRECKSYLEKNQDIITL